MIGRSTVVRDDVANGAATPELMSPPRLPSSVSIVIPCYNYGRYLPDCVASVLGQEGVDVRVLIIDDASTDNSARVAAACTAADARVEVRSHPTNHGHIRTYNEGLEWATGTYTVLLSADDMLTPGSLGRACALLDAHPEVGFVYGRGLLFWGDRPRRRARRGQGRWTIWAGHEWFEMRCRTAENCVNSPEVVVRSHLLRRLGGYREELPHTADLEMWMRLALYADVGYVAGPHQAYYRDHATSMRHQRFGTPLADLAQIRAAFEVLFRDHGQVIADRSRLETLVRRTLARRALQAACRVYDRGDFSATEVAGLEELAVTAYRDAQTLGELRSLQWRQRLGPRVCRILQPFLVVAAVQRLHQRLGQRRLRRSGL